MTRSLTGNTGQETQPTGVKKPLHVVFDFDCTFAKGHVYRFISKLLGTPNVDKKYIDYYGFNETPDGILQKTLLLNDNDLKEITEENLKENIAKFIEYCTNDMFPEYYKYVKNLEKFQTMIKNSGIYSEAVFHICSMGYEEYIRDALVAANLIKFFTTGSENEKPDSPDKPKLRIYGAYYKGKFGNMSPANDGLVDGNKVKILSYLAGDRSESNKLNPNALDVSQKEFDNMGALKNTKKGDVIIFDDGEIGNKPAKDFISGICKNDKQTNETIWRNCIWGADVGIKEGDIYNYQYEEREKTFHPRMLTDTKESFWLNESNKSIMAAKNKVIAEKLEKKKTARCCRKA